MLQEDTHNKLLLSKVRINHFYQGSSITYRIIQCLVSIQHKFSVTETVIMTATKGSNDILLNVIIENILDLRHSTSPKDLLTSCSHKKMLPFMNNINLEV